MKRILLHAVLQSRLMDQKRAIASIIDEVLARPGITRVDDLVAWTHVCASEEQTRVGLGTVKHLHSDHLFNVHFVFQMDIHLPRVLAERLEVIQFRIYLLESQWIAFFVVEGSWIAVVDDILGSQASVLIVRCTVLIQLIIVLVFRVQVPRRNKHDHLRILKGILNECFQPLHHGRRCHYVQFIIGIKAFEKLVPLVNYFEYAKLVVSMDMCDEYEVGFSDDFVQEFFRFEVVPELGVRSFGAIHEKSVAILPDVDGRGVPEH